MFKRNSAATAAVAVVIGIFTSGCGNAPGVSAEYLVQAQHEELKALKALLEKSAVPKEQGPAPAKRRRNAAAAKAAKAAEAAEDQKALEQAQAKVRDLEAQSARQEAEARKAREATMAMREALLASNARLASLERARLEEAAAKKAAEEARKAAEEAEAKARAEAEAEAEAEAKESQSPESTRASPNSRNSRPGPIRRVFGRLLRIFRCR